MNVFDLRDKLIQDYATYTQSFIQIRDPRNQAYVRDTVEAGALWPRPLIQLNPSFERGQSLAALRDAGILHPECLKVFRKDKDRGETHHQGRELKLHRHQSEAIRVDSGGHNHVPTTGTGSGKSLAYIIPIVDQVQWPWCTGHRRLPLLEAALVTDTIKSARSALGLWQLGM